MSFLIADVPQGSSADWMPLPQPTVTQEDRDAAAVYGIAVQILTRQEAGKMLNGGNDDCTLVQAFARHREAAEQRVRAALAAIQEAKQ